MYGNDSGMFIFSSVIGGNFGLDYNSIVIFSNMGLLFMLFVKNLVKVSICKVCGDEFLGFYYGVDSCEGCKVCMYF